MWTFVALVILLLGIWIVYRKKYFSQLKELGIPGPEPNLLFGNALELVFRNPLTCHTEWISKFGKVVGYYFGTSPVVLIADVNHLKRIQVSEFQHFINRPNIFGSSRVNSKKRDEGFSEQLTILRDKRWKDVRSILTPSFTTSKMKQMVPLMNGAISSLANNVEKKCVAGDSFDIYKLYQRLTMDVIGRTAFGIQTDVQNNPDDPFLRSSQALFSGDIKNPLFIFGVSFRSLARFWSWIGRLRLTFKNKGTNPIKELLRSVKGVIATRRRNPESRRPDLLQLMLDAEIDDVDSVTGNDLTADVDKEIQETKKTGATSGKDLKKMTDHDVLDNSLLFFLAAYETTSTALAFVTHLLIKHQDVQEKVREDVLQLIKSEGKLDYNAVAKLQYLDQIILESLRLYPPVYLFVNREVAEDVDLGEFQLKKGHAIQVAVYNLHRDPELWEEPDEFRPERFAPENKSKINPLAFQPFGQGPRNCIGMRFALMEAKLALATLLSKYKFKACAETEKEVTLKISPAFINPKNGIWTKAIPLEEQK